MNRIFTKTIAIFYFSLPLFAADLNEENSFGVDITHIDLNQPLMNVEDESAVEKTSIHAKAINIKAHNINSNNEQPTKTHLRKKIFSQEEKLKFFEKLFPEYEEGEEVFLSEGQFKEYIQFLSRFDDEDILKHAINSTRELIENIKSPHSISFINELVKDDRYELFLRVFHDVKITLKEIKRDDYTQIAKLLLDLLLSSRDPKILDYAFQIFMKAWTSRFVINKIQSLTASFNEIVKSKGEKKRVVEKFLEDICIETGKNPTSVKIAEHLTISLEEVTRKQKKIEVRRREANHTRAMFIRKNAQKKRKREDERLRKEKLKTREESREDMVPTSVHVNPAFFAELAPKNQLNHIYVPYTLLLDDENADD